MAPEEQPSTARWPSTGSDADVDFPPGFRERVGALRLQLSAARQSREGAGQAHLQGGGGDLIGFRPYSPGEDLRQLDWNLLARLDKPFVRVTRREAGELWVVALDASASMGVGPPGKLQRAAECCVSLWALAGLHRAPIRILVAQGEGQAPEVLNSPAPRGLDAPIGFLEGLQASGSSGLGGLLAMGRLFRDATRVYCIGDLCDRPMRAMLGLRQRVRELRVLQLLAPHEFDPPLGNVEWWDPESGEHLKRSVGAADRLEYQTQLEDRLEGWRDLAGKHRFHFDARSSAVPFEDLMRDLTKA